MVDAKEGVSGKMYPELPEEETDRYIPGFLQETRTLCGIVSRLASSTQDGIKHPEMHKK